MDAGGMGYSPSTGDRNTAHGMSPPEDTDLVGGLDVEIADILERDSDGPLIATMHSTNRLDSMPFWMAAMLDSGFRWC